MPKRTCSIPDCAKPVVGRTWCRTHYSRWWRKNARDTRSRRVPLADRLWATVDRRGPDDCWPWTGSISRSGYGQIEVAGRGIRAHRLVYELLVGPVPIGATLDHLCHNAAEPPCLLDKVCPHRRCMNPAHLEPVTSGVNVLRGNGPAARNARKTHCKRGHPFDAENTYRSPNGARHCRICRAGADRRSRARRRYAA